jgi:hypothetical protein
MTETEEGNETEEGWRRTAKDWVLTVTASDLLFEKLSSVFEFISSHQEEIKEVIQLVLQILGILYFALALIKGIGKSPGHPN